MPTIVKTWDWSEGIQDWSAGTGQDGDPTFTINRFVMSDSADGSSDLSASYSVDPETAGPDTGIFYTGKWTDLGIPDGATITGFRVSYDGNETGIRARYDSSQAGATVALINCLIRDSSNNIVWTFIDVIVQDQKTFKFYPANGSDITDLKIPATEDAKIQLGYLGSAGVITLPGDFDFVNQSYNLFRLIVDYKMPAWMPDVHIGRPK